MDEENYEVIDIDDGNGDEVMNKIPKRATWCFYMSFISKILAMICLLIIAVLNDDCKSKRLHKKTISYISVVFDGVSTVTILK